MQTIVFKDHNPELFSITHYPDGQQSINLNMALLDVKKPVSIKCRIKNFSDLEIFLCLVASLRKHDFYIESIQFIYLFGMRSDRSFSHGQENYFRDVIAPLINNLEIPEVYVFAPHNEITLNYIKGHVRDFLIDKPKGFYLWGDKSASYLKKSLPFNCDEEGSVIGCFEKYRTIHDINVHMSIETEMRLLSIQSESTPIIIMDDLCDAGGTFIAARKYLQSQKKPIKNPIYLFIAHGLFTKGLDVLFENFDRIYCTNSYQDIIHPNLQQIQVI